MSNDKHAYGWSGHILVSDAEHDKIKEENVVKIPAHVFNALLSHFENCKLDDRIRVERLGVTDSDFYFLAVGHPNSFSVGYTFYGCVFTEADDRQDAPLVDDPKETQDKVYLAAMKQIYGLDLPECRLMVGCSSEH
jgi:hypothetical protein